MKSWIRFFLASALVLLTASRAHAVAQLAVTAVTPSVTSARPGDTVTFTVAIANNTPVPQGATATVDFGGGSLDVILTLTSPTLDTINLGRSTVTIPQPGITAGGGTVNVTTNRTIPLSYSQAGGYMINASIDFAPTSRATASAALSAAVSAVNLTALGSGYTSAPTVNFAGGGGAGAAAVAVVAGGAVVAVHVTNPGSAYTSTPTVTFTGGGGSGAAAAATIRGTVSTLAFTGSGTGYAGKPTVVFTGGGGGTGAAATMNATGTVTAIQVNGAGTGYSSAPAVALSGGGGAGATGTATIVTTSVSAVNVTAGGANYSAAPTLAFTGGGGSGAAATVALNGAVTSILVASGGSGYTTPTVSFSGGGGSGATATATVGGGVITGITVTLGGSGYTSAPTVTISDPIGTGATAVATISGPVASVTVSAGGSGYTSAPTVSLTGGGGAGATATAVVSGTLSSIAVNTAGAGYTSAPTVTLSGGGGTGASATARLTYDAGTGAIDAAGAGYTTAPDVSLSGGGDGGLNTITGASFSSAPSAFSVSGTPDLAITSLSYPAGVAYTGGTVIPMSLTYVNRVSSSTATNVPVVFSGSGNPVGALNPLRIQVVLSSNPQYGDADDFQLTLHDITSTVNADGVTHTFSWNQLLPGNFAGSYYVLAKIDSLSAVSETIEDDTIYAGNNIWLDVNATRIALLASNFPTVALTSTTATATTAGTSANGYSDNPSISGDGRYTAFASDASNLAAGDTNGQRDIFVFDNLNKTVRRLSVSQQGAQANGPSNNPALASSGNYVAFASDATNLILGDSNAFSDIFVVDTITGAITRESISTASAQADGASFRPALSQNGRYLVFESSATNLVSPSTAVGITHIYLRDRTAGTTVLVSQATAGTRGNGSSLQPVVSDDGNYVAFASDATNLVASDTNALRDIFLRDIGAATTIRVSVGPAGIQSVGGAAGGASRAPSISADGRYVAFSSDATNLVVGDTNAVSDVFVYDRLGSPAPTTTRLSVANSRGEGADPSGAPFNVGSFNPNISSDGRYVTFASLDANLAPGDALGQYGTLASATVAGGAVTSITITNPGGGDPFASTSAASGTLAGVTAAYYEVVPNVTLSGGGGTGATATAVLSGTGGTRGYITGITVNTAGSGYTSAPNVTIAASFNSALNIYVIDRQATGAGTFDAVDNIATSIASLNKYGYQTVRVLGVQSSAASDIYPVISRDGRWVAMPSDAEGNSGLAHTTTNQLSNDNNGARDIFLHDRRISSVPSNGSPPVVTITEPGSTTPVLVNTATTVKAGATAATGSTVSSVQFYVNGTSLGTSSTFPYTQTWTPTAVGTFTLSALVTDNFGNQGVSPNVVVTVNAKPAVSIADPGPQTLGANVALTATAVATTPGATIASVEFFANSKSIATADTTAPYGAVWVPDATGTISLTAEAIDSMGTHATSTAVLVVVSNGATTPPGVTLGLPANGATIPVNTAQTITADATPSAGTSIASVQFNVNGVSAGLDTTFPFSVAWTPATPGTYTLTVVATDNLGAQKSDTHTVTVVATAAPTVTLTSPAAGSATLGSSFTLRATAADADGTVASVRFLVNSAAIATDTTSPYSATWTPTAAGSYSIIAEATDNSGQITRSTPAVTVTITGATGTPPTVALGNPSSDITITKDSSLFLTANASDTDGTITSTSFYANGVLLNTPTNGFLNYVWSPTTPGTYDVTAVATDNSGNTVSSAPITVTVNSAGTPGTFSVNLISPADGSSVVVFNNVTIRANTNVPDSNSPQVDLYSGNNLIETVTTAPYEVVRNPARTGTFQFTAVVRTGSSVYTSQPIYINALANGAPTVAVVTPHANNVVQLGTTIALQATASDTDNGIASVTFLVNGMAQGSPVTSAPYTVDWTPVATGTYTITALAKDGLNSVGGLETLSTPVTVTVTAPGNPTGAPTVSIISPAASSLITTASTVSITAGASDPNGTIASVSFYADGTLLGTATTAPFTQSWSPAGLGRHLLTAVATDNSGIAVLSPTVAITATSASGSGASGAFTYPSNNSIIPVNQPTTVRTSITPGSSAITSVSFFLNGIAQGVDSVYPYEFAWTPTNLGGYTLAATITDASGNSTGIPSVSVTVGGASGVTVLTSTATNALVPQGSSIVLSADVNLGQGAVKQFQFYDNGVALGSPDTTAPYTIVYSPSGGAGTVHALTAQATDNNNAALPVSAALTITVSNAVTPLPTVAITSPRDSFKIPTPDYVADPTAAVTVTVDAQKPSGRITKVELYVDGDLLHDKGGAVGGIKTSYPYNFTWQPATAGTYYLIALVYDDKGNVVASNTSLTASSTPTPTTVIVSPPPSAAITSPADFSTVTGDSITQASVTATSSNGYPVNVQLFFDDKYVGETTVPSAGAIRTVSFTPIPRRVYDSNGNMSILPSHLYLIASDPLGFSSSTKATWLTLNVTDGGNSPSPTVIGNPPTVSVTDPLGGSVFPVGAPIKLSANAVDSDGNIVQVILSANGQTVSTLSAYPYNTTWKPTNLGTYAISAKVTDNDGNTVTSSAVTVNITDSGPSGTSVAITAPVTGAAFTVATETTLRATAIDDVSIANVQYFINSQPFGDKILAAPYNLKWTPLAAGTYTIFARATDNVGNQATSASVVVTVNANAVPTVKLTSPVTGTTIVSGNSVALAATASDSDGTIKSVQFLANNLVVGTSTAAPYTAAWTPSGPGTYTLAAQATDDSGNITVSSSVQLTVASNQSPSVSLTSPKTGSGVSVGTSTTLTATAADADGNVAKVQFYANGTLINQATTTPYQVSWTPTAEGTYRLTAVATDNAGATVTSAIVVVAAVSGTNAVDTVATGLYLNYNTSDSGTFSIINLHGRSVTFIGYVPATQATSAPKVYYFANAPLDSAGNFQLTNATGGVIFSGQFSATGASGSFTDSGNSIMFGGTNTTAKANAAPSGYYSGSVTGHPGSLLTGFVGLDGMITVYAQDGTFADAGAAAVSTTGAFSITTRSNNVIAGTADPNTGLLTGTISKAGITGSDSFTGAQASGSTFSDGSLRNISSRGWVGTGDNVMIAGFVVNGTSPKQVLIRAVGPTLGSMGVTGALANPVLYLNDHNGAPLTFNDNWGTAGATIASTASLVGAQPLPAGSLDSTILTTLAPGAYTAQVSGVGNGTGIALVELYDVDNVAAFSTEKMVNIATRGFVGTGDNLLIAGFVVNGTSPKKILVRGIGPGLATVGLSGGILADPLLRIVRANGPLIRENDNWGSGNDTVLVIDAAAKVGAFPLVVGSKDAVILMNLPPGVYSAQLSGSGTSTGVGMIEVYEVQ